MKDTKKKIQTIAMYLPQFHRLPENDEWWGEGFTEWTAVKAAEKLFEDHNQPRKPLNDNYYNLLEKDTMRWQAEIAHKYGVDGFCFYHYYFKDGRKILEQPAENLLKWKDVNMRFCFCWANQTWARTWGNISSSNTWSEKFEKKDDIGQTILLEQGYGTIKDWSNHFEYLLPFFKDDRYIKLDNKPVFIFYKPDDITVLNEMIECWNELGQKNGFEGIYIIGANVTVQSEKMDAVLLQGPAAYRNPVIAGMYVKDEWMDNVKGHDYQKIWNNAIKAKSFGEVKTFFGGFADYDDTPRRGRLGNCTLDVLPEKFENNLFALAVKNMVAGNEFLFINAWNEWGEGNYLEPDEKNGYQFLEAVERITEKCNADDFDALQVWEELKEKVGQSHFEDEERQGLLSDLNKFRRFYSLLDRWMVLKEKGIGIDQYFINNGYQKIVIYGFASMGKHLYEELKESQLEIICAMDRRQGLSYVGIDILEAEEKIPECDIIVITAICDYEEIAGKLKEKTDTTIVSLQDVIFF